MKDTLAYQAVAALVEAQPIGRPDYRRSRARTNDRYPYDAVIREYLGVPGNTLVLEECQFTSATAAYDAALSYIECQRETMIAGVLRHELGSPILPVRA